MAAGTPVPGARIKREKNRLYFVDAAGQVRSVKRRTGGKAGRKSCWPRKSPVTGRKVMHPGERSEGRKTHRKSSDRKSHRKTSHHKTGHHRGHRRSFRLSGAAAASYAKARGAAFAKSRKLRTSRHSSRRR